MTNYQQKGPLMKTIPILLLFATVAAPALLAQPALTIYNQDFAVVRDTVRLDLSAGENTVNYSGATAHVEPDSVILRDPGGTHSFQILEQNYRNDPVSQGLLLSLFEGKTIDFQTTGRDGQTSLVQGKIVRSGYAPHDSPIDMDSDQDQSQPDDTATENQPIIEVDGKMRFGLPGQPLFPDLGDDTILKPTLNWLI